jgi:predicted Zn finger-like uncharacterized protein
MSLITRCPACGTMFKVVTDQLKVSRGWVRCGRCAHVFDAPPNLQPVGTVPSEPVDPVATEKVGGSTAPPPEVAASIVETPLRPAPVARVAPRWIADAAPPASSQPEAEISGDASDDDADFDPVAWRNAQKRRQQEQSGHAHSLPSPLGITRPASIGSVAARGDDIDSLVDASADSSMDESAGAAASPRLDAQQPVRPAQVRTETPDETYVRYDFGDSDQSDLPVAREVSFVREAKRKAFWSRRGVRVGLVSLTILMLCTLALQLALMRRDDLAMVNPGLAPLLTRACALAGCEIRAPRHIDSLVIDSSTFSKIGTDAYRLTFVLKNTGSIPVEVPSIEVTLTDPQDQALIRRVVIPAQFGASARTLAARADLGGSLSMKVVADAGRSNPDAVTQEAGSPLSSPLAAPLPVAGYRLVAFYP